MHLVLHSRANFIQAATGWVLAVFPPCVPPVRPTSDSVFEGTLATAVDYLMTVPTFVEVSCSPSHLRTT